jgi:hypothetical protein
MRLLVSLAVVLAASPAFAQQMYKWVDQAGKVHYSDQPPPETAKGGKKLEIRAAPAGASGTTTAAAPAGAKSAADLDMDFRKRQLQKAEADQKAKKDAEANVEKQKNCTEAKNRMTSLERGGRVSRYGPNGEQQFLTDEEIAREVVAQRKVIDSWCN